MRRFEGKNDLFQNRRVDWCGFGLIAVIGIPVTVQRPDKLFFNQKNERRQFYSYVGLSDAERSDGPAS